MSKIYPTEFEGFEMLAPTPAEKGQFCAGGAITAKADGKIYILTSNNSVVRKGWTILTSCYSRCAKDGKLKGTFYIAEREVKAGDVVELPKFKGTWGSLVLAKSIEY